jgi:hypothetical protein
VAEKKDCDCRPAQMTEAYLRIPDWRSAEIIDRDLAQNAASLDYGLQMKSNP